MRDRIVSSRIFHGLPMPAAALPNCDEMMTVPGLEKARMGRLAKTTAAVCVSAIAYMAWPFYSALQIRDAMIAGDTSTLARKIEWESVRATLKASMSAETLARLEKAPDAPKPSLWQRVKATVAPRMAESVIDRYVTPEQLPVFLGYRRIWRGTVQPVIGPAEPKTVLADTWLGGTPVDRLVSFYRRVRRAVFHSLTRFELEMEDKYRPDRRYTSVFELKGFDWKLTALSVSGAGF